MKKTTLLSIFLFLAISVFGQVRAPFLSPFQTIEQRVGLTDITIQYSRPSMKGRTIFGGLEPYNTVWRTGANRSSKITFSETVHIGGKDLVAGTYSIFTKPNPKEWVVYFYTDNSHWEAPNPMEPSKIAIEITVPVIQLSKTVETLTLSIDDLTENAANLALMWENTYVAVPIKFYTNEVMTAIIDKELGSYSTDYHIAAAYYFNRDLDLEKAKIWIEKAIFVRTKPDYWDHQLLALILDKMGDRKTAIQEMKLAYTIAKKDNKKTGTIETEAKLKEWGVK